MLSLMFSVASARSFAHDDLAGREKEFYNGYRVGYITAVREAAEGQSMCTKEVPLLEVIHVIGAYIKTKGITPNAAFSVKNITDALAAKYRCPKK